MSMGLMMQRARINHQPHLGPGTTWIDAYMAASGINIWAFEFDNNLLDSSGKGNNATGSGVITYTADDPAPSGGNCANVTGSSYANLPIGAIVVGNNPFTIIGIVKVPPAGFGNNILWMGGGQNGSPSAHWASSMSFWGSGTAPRLHCDFAYDNVGYAFPAALVNSWMTAIIEYDPTAGKINFYVAGRGATGYTLIGSSTNQYDGKVSGGYNALFQWGGIRRFNGKCAFVGLKQGVLTAAEKKTFLIP